MIHKLLNLTRPLFVLDAETTGVATSKDRIVELAFEQWNADGLVNEWRSLVNPGVPISAGSMKVHGITDVKMKSCRICGGFKDTEGPFCSCEEFHPIPTFAQIAAKLAKGLSNCDFAGKNVRFDLRILTSEFLRAGVPWSIAGARIVDADRLEQLGDPRSLVNLVKKHLNEDMGSEAHTALGDVQWTSKLIGAQLQAYQQLPRDLDTLHAAQFPGMIDLDGKFQFVDGVACFSRWGKYQGKPMNHPDLNRVVRGESYWDFILKGDFSPEVKAIAANAKLGKFPEAR